MLLAFLFFSFFFSFHLAKNTRFENPEELEGQVGTRQKPLCFRPRGWLLPHVR